MNNHTQNFKIVTISHLFAIAFLVAGAVLMNPMTALADDSYDSGYSGTSVDYSSTNYDTSAYNSGYSGTAIDYGSTNYGTSAYDSGYSGTSINYGSTNYGTSAYDSGYSGTNVDTASNNYSTTGYDSGYSGTGVSYDSNNYGGNNLYASNGNDLYASTCATGCGAGNSLYASDGNNLYASNSNDLYASNGNNLYASNGGNNLYASSQGNNLYASTGGCTTGSCGGSYYSGNGYSTGCTTGCGSANGGSSAYWTNAGYWTGGSGGSYGGCSGSCGSVPPPVVDCCPNLAGLQTSIPAGYVLQNGNCVQQPVYTCPSGTYGSYPNCVTPAPVVYNNGAPCCTAAPVVYNNPPVVYNNQPVYNHQPYVSLTQVPYTGLDLTPAQEILYWGFLVLWCLLAAYLIAVKKIQNRIAAWFKRVFFGDEDATATHTAEAYAASIPMAPGYAARVAEVDVIDEFILMQINRPSRA